MKNTHIEWCDHTFNPWIGCTKVSPGCANCYAEARDQRFADGKHWGKGAPRQRTSAANWKQPLRWDKVSICAKCGAAETEPYRYKCCEGQLRRPRVFCASLADWLDDEVPIEWLADLLKLIHDTPHLDWLLLTKRPENWKSRMVAAMRHLEDHGGSDDGSQELHSWILDWVSIEKTPDNIWIGTTVEDQQRADERIPRLLSIPAKVRFLSCEPLLGPVEIEDWLQPQSAERATLHARRTGHQCGAAAMVFTCEQCGLSTFSEKDQSLNWIICGGESGPGARPMHPEWARSLRDQCLEARVPFFFKQWGEWGKWGNSKESCPDRNCESFLFRSGNTESLMFHLGKRTAGRLLDGQGWNDTP